MKEKLLKHSAVPGIDSDMIKYHVRPVVRKYSKYPSNLNVIPSTLDPSELCGSYNLTKHAKLPSIS